MATVIKTPGVYIEEVSSFPPSVAQVATAIPAFLGYTEKSVSEPKRIKSFAEYLQTFGGPDKEIVVTLSTGINTGDPDYVSSVSSPDKKYLLYYAMQHYFQNGGGPCYVISTGQIAGTASILKADFESALAKLKKEDEPTLIVLTDAVNLTDAADKDVKYHDLLKAALAQCADLQDRFCVMDLYQDTGDIDADTLHFRNGVGTQNLKYGASYYPRLVSSLAYGDSAIVFSHVGAPTGESLDGMTLAEAKEAAAAEDPAGATPLSDILQAAVAEINLKLAEDAYKITLPPSAAICGVYAAVDASRGVWKAPANVSLSGVVKPSTKIDNDDQENMNVSDTGKSINAIRTFAGKGVLVWGARTLAGSTLR